MNKERSKQNFEEVVRNSYNAPNIRPEYYKKLNTDLLVKADKQENRSKKPGFAVNFAIGATAIVTVLVLFFAYVPQGRALAETIRHLFTTTTVIEIPVEDPAGVVAPTSAPVFQVVLEPYEESLISETLVPAQSNSGTTLDPVCESDPNGYTCQVSRAEKKAGFDIKELPADPHGFKFSEINVSESGEVSIMYERISGGAYLFLFQGVGGLSSMHGSVPEDAIQEVQVGDSLGEYVAGGFFSDGNPPVYKWINSSIYSLRWTEGDSWHEVRAEGCVDPGNCSSSDELIRIAQSLVFDPGSQTELRADYLKSSEEASQISGFTILTPTLLPEGFRFDHGTYDEDSNQINLSYKPVGYGLGVAEVMIKERPINEIPDSAGEDWEVKGDVVDINGQTGYYLSESPYTHILSWESKELRFSLIIYTSEMWYGGSFTMEQVLEIARSIQ